MKTYTIKAYDSEMKRHLSPAQLEDLKAHVEEIASWRDDQRAVVEERDIRNAADMALRAYWGDDQPVYIGNIFTVSCYAGFDCYRPMVMADVTVLYYRKEKYHVARLSALSIERYWTGDPMRAYVINYTETGDRCI